MKKINHSNLCRKIRGPQGGWAILKERLRQRLGDHIATCPRCQKRLALANRVEVAVSLLKSQPHELNLLARANAKAIGVLKHSLRNAPQTRQLRQSKPDFNWIEKKRPAVERLFNVAACLFVVLMIRMGVFSSMTDVQAKGKTALHNYYARNLDNQMVNEIFPDDSMPA